VGIMKVFVVFILPVILSVTLATAVTFDILDRPGRELDMWPQSTSHVGHGGQDQDSDIGDATHDTDTRISIMGLSQSYAAGEVLSVGVTVHDPSFDCGDLYITVYLADSNTVLSQGAFFEQCFVADGLGLPTEGEFSTAIDTPGRYVITADMTSPAGSNISTSEVFVVK